MFIDYFNYLSTFSTVTFAIALLVAIPLGIFLCRRNLKFILLSLAGLGSVTIYMAQSTVAIVTQFQNNGHNLAAILVQAVLPPAFFFVVAVGIVRYGMQISTGSRYVKDTSFRWQTAWSSFWHWFITREGIAVTLIAAAVFTVHLVYIANPSPPAIVDEGYYVADANNFLHGTSMAYPEHPPLGKWLIASSIFLFGDNGARVFPVLFSIASIFIFYFVSRRLVRDTEHSAIVSLVPVLATFLFAIENLAFVMGHAAMLDVFYVTFMLLGFLFYLRGNYVSSGVSLGLSLLCKETAILGIAVIVLHWTISRAKVLAKELKYVWSTLRGGQTIAPSNEISNMFKMLAVVVVVWGVLLVPLDYRSIHQFPKSSQLLNPMSRTLYIFAHPMAQTFGMDLGDSTGLPRFPWLWIVSPSSLNVDNNIPGAITRYLGSVSWNILPFIVPVIVYMVYRVIRYRGDKVPLFLLSWLFGVYGLLIVLELLTHRIMYDFYFYPVVPAVCLAIAWAAWKLWERARGDVKARKVFIAGLSLYLVATVATFIIMSPLGTNLVYLPP